MSKYAEPFSIEAARGTVSAFDRWADSGYESDQCLTAMLGVELDHAIEEIERLTAENAALRAGVGKRLGYAVEQQTSMLPVLHPTAGQALRWAQLWGGRVVVVSELPEGGDGR